MGQIELNGMLMLNWIVRKKNCFSFRIKPYVNKLLMFNWIVRDK